MFEFSELLNKLEKTNPAIIYSFNPESTPQRQMGVETFKTTLLPEAYQHLDMLNGYLYLEKDILPVLKEKKGNISSETLLKWFNTLHGHMNKTLMEFGNEKSGEYTKRSVTRWHKNGMMSVYFVEYFSGRLNIKNDTEFANLLIKNFGVDEKNIVEFIKILRKIEKNNEIKVPESQIQFIKKQDKSGWKGLTLMHKLQPAYLENFLTTDEKLIVDSIAKICRYPEDSPKIMEKFAQKTIEKLQNCPSDDLDKIVEFLAEFMYEFTDIHAYGNGNGRVATAMVNAFLIYFGKPSILLRLPGERSDENSDYNNAFKQIDITREPLAKLIKNRILATENEEYSNEVLCKTIEARVNMAVSMKKILEKNSKFDLETIRNSVQVKEEECQKIIEEQGEEMLGLVLLDLMLENTRKKEKELYSFKINNNLLTSLSNENKNKLKDGLFNLTGVEGWKISANGSWIELSDNKKALELVQKLNDATVGKITLSKVKEKESWVVQCTNYDFKKIVSNKNVISVNLNNKKN